MKLKESFYFLLFTLLFVVPLSLFAEEMSIGIINPVANPAAVYCSDLGYGYEVKDTPEGQIGICKFSEVDEAVAWNFLSGTEAIDRSYCSNKGYESKVVDDYEKCGLAYKNNFGCLLCVLEGGEEVSPLGLLMADKENGSIDLDNEPENPDDNNSTDVDLVLDITDDAMYQRLRGKILLKVEDDGRAYYVHPSVRKAYYLGRPKDAFRIMREQGVGIVNKDLEKILVGLDVLRGADSDNDGLPDLFEDAIGTQKANSDTDGDGFSDRDELSGAYNPLGGGMLSIDSSFTNKHLGKIFLQVEGSGEAWYIYESKRHYLGRPADAFAIMRFLSLGIANSDFDKLVE